MHMFRPGKTNIGKTESNAISLGKTTKQNNCVIQTQ